MSLQDYRDLVSNLVRDEENRISATDVDTAISLMVLRYSSDQPRTVVEDVTQDTTGPLLALPAGWVTGLSELEAIEFPVGELPPSYLAMDYPVIYQSPTGQQLMLSETVYNGEQLRLTFTAPHQLDDVADTVPVQHREACASYAAALVCEQLAAIYSHDSDNVIQADSVDHQDKSRKFGQRAKTLKETYRQHLGASPVRADIASVTVDLDRTNSIGGDRLFHKGKYR